MFLSTLPIYTHCKAYATPVDYNSSFVFNIPQFCWFFSFNLVWNSLYSSINSGILKYSGKLGMILLLCLVKWQSMRIFIQEEHFRMQREFWSYPWSALRGQLETCWMLSVPVQLMFFTSQSAGQLFMISFSVMSEVMSLFSIYSGNIFVIITKFVSYQTPCVYLAVLLCESLRRGDDEW